MKILIPALLATLVATSVSAADVIRKPGLYTSPNGTTSLRISDSEIPKAVFTYVHEDGKKTSSQILLSPGSAWACWLQDEWTVWTYRAEDSFVLAITIIPPEEGAQFRTASRKVSIADEFDAIPAELRAVIKEKKEPNKAMEPTPVSVTISAAQKVAPLTSVAHLSSEGIRLAK
jgi:hypothetical protein